MSGYAGRPSDTSVPDAEGPPCRVLVVDTRSPLEANRSGGSTAFIRNILPYTPEDWIVATPAPDLEAMSDNARTSRFVSLGPALRRRMVPERIQIALRVLKHRRLLRRLRPRVVYCHSNEVAMVNMILVGTLFPGSAFVLHQHGAENPLARATYPWARHRLLVDYYDRLLRAAHRKCDRIVVIDDVSRRKNELWGLGERLIFLPNAVDTARYLPRAVSVPQARATWSLPESGWVFLHAGRMEEIKRQDVIISAFEIWARDEDTAGVLVLAGEGTLQERLRERVDRSPARDRIRFLGFVPPDRMASLMQATDCFILASEAEGVPMVLLESLACGVPFIAPAIGGIPELAGSDRGILTPPSPAADVLASAMRAACATEWSASGIRRYAMGLGAQTAVGKLEREFLALRPGTRYGR